MSTEFFNWVNTVGNVFLLCVILYRLFRNHITTLERWIYGFNAVVIAWEVTVYFLRAMEIISSPVFHSLQRPNNPLQISGLLMLVLFYRSVTNYASKEEIIELIAKVHKTLDEDCGKNNKE